MTKLEKDQLIANYMDLSVDELHGELCWADWNGMHTVKYSEEWNWIMPVVLKILSEYTSEAIIEHPGYVNYPSGNTKWGFSMLNDCIDSVSGANDDPLLAVYDTVVTFLAESKSKTQ